MQRPERERKEPTEFNVIVKAKDLVKHTFTITNSTERYPKKYRFTLVNRIQDKAVDIYECVLEANELDLRDTQEYRQRQKLQAKALTYCKELLFFITDPDGDTVNVVEKIDGKTIATKNAITLGATQTLSVAGNTFTALTNAQHTITITATDSAGNSAVRTLTFTKSIAGFVITLSAPLEANSQPTRANIKVTRDIPAGGTFKVEATNNPFDASPVWEDCTNAVIQGVAHVFTNKINTAAQHGMNIRVTVQRGDALTACWVSGIGGNFE